MKLPSKKIIGFGLVAALAASFMLWSRLKPQPLPTTIKPEIRDVTQVLEVSGSIDAVEKADLHFSAPSRLAWVGVKEGDTVKKWQTIATVDTQTMKKQLQQSMNTFEKSWRANDQTLDDTEYYENKELSMELKRIVENSQFDLRNAALSVEIQDLAIRLSSLISPIEGIVTHMDKPFAGANVGMTDIYQVVNPKTLYFAAIVDEVDIGQIREGQTAEIALDAYPNDPITSVVKKIEFVPSPGKNGGTGYKVHLELQAAESSGYRLGMNGTGTITLAEQKNVLTVPVEALISRDGKTFVEVLLDKKREMREIEVGLETDDYAEVISGIDQLSAVIVPESSESK